MERSKEESREDRKGAAWKAAGKTGEKATWKAAGKKAETTGEKAR